MALLPFYGRLTFFNSMWNKYIKTKNQYSCDGLIFSGGGGGGGKDINVVMSSIGYKTFKH